MNNEFKNKKITVMGLGLFGGGVGVTKFLVRHGACVTLTDLRNASELAPSIKQLEGLPVSYKLGGHYEEDFVNADMIIVNPAVSKDSKFLQIARNNNVSLNTEMNIFFKLCPAQIIGITGSNGKSTTTTIIGQIIQQTQRKTWTGGNIGKSLLIHLKEIKPSDIVVLELSSFQLEELNNIKKSPHISVLTNISPNHLDRHPTMDDYIKAKKSIILHQGFEDYAILNYDDHELRRWERECKGNICWYSTKHALNNGVFIKDDNIVLLINGNKALIPNISRIKIPGDHNLQNILAASCASYLAGANKSHIKNIITNFTGLEHRLEFVSEVNGVKYYNDSKATTPESTIAAIKAFNAPVILIAGGYDKGSCFEEFAETCAKYTKAVVLIGKTAEKIRGLILTKKGVQKAPSIIKSNTFKEAFEQANTYAEKGDVVLLSPACASYDMFINYEERGRQFKEMVNAL
ncbi:MAG: UDP-N-acetylmuramoylalanine--D-glutamate ligase [Planctomycetes bacterium RIFCSPHIGHO2_02_FULL_38_41]|nr:MAG: UDP-N-acetylmuramoylalanine--D-glutamate ligase [Planctomycetes bacterium RIFCSPHIGHO2_02_FULL_38_41]OHC02133.1 MAG: UDP-N-acetylmuramoylalanine--D-glutamate ligase [Planctomycetes bacterium RIFCSPHIGHO2_12_39_6]